jgi:hypothetical protein
MFFLKLVQLVISNDLQNTVTPWFAFEQSQGFCRQHLGASHGHINTRLAQRGHGLGSRDTRAAIRSKK